MTMTWRRRRQCKLPLTAPPAAAKSRDSRSTRHVDHLRAAQHVRPRAARRIDQHPEIADAERCERQKCADEAKHRVREPKRTAISGLDVQTPGEHPNGLAPPHPEVGEECKRLDERHTL